MAKTKEDYITKRNHDLIIPKQTITYNKQVYTYYATIGTREEAEDIYNKKLEEGFAIKRKRVKGLNGHTLYFHLYIRECLAKTHKTKTDFQFKTGSNFCLIDQFQLIRELGKIKNRINENPAHAKNMLYHLIKNIQNEEGKCFKKKEKV